MDKFSELKAVAEKAKELAGINNYKKGKDAIAAFKAAANPAAILALLAELEANKQTFHLLTNDSALSEAKLEEAQQRIDELSRLLTHNIERAEEAEKRLATPVRLPDIEFVKISGIDFPVMRADIVKKEVRRAGFTVEGDE